MLQLAYFIDPEMHFFPPHFNISEVESVLQSMTFFESKSWWEMDGRF